MPAESGGRRPTEENKVAALEACYEEEHRLVSVFLETVQDVDAMIEALVGLPYPKAIAQLFSTGRPLLSSDTPDHQMLIGADGSRGVGVVWFSHTEGTVFSLRKNSTDETIVRYFLMGSVIEFFENCEIPLDNVRNAVKEFLVTDGQIPTCIEWQRAKLWYGEL